MLYATPRPTKNKRRITRHAIDVKAEIAWRIMKWGAVSAQKMRKEIEVRYGAPVMLSQIVRIIGYLRSEKGADIETIGGCGITVYYRIAPCSPEPRWDDAFDDDAPVTQAQENHRAKHSSEHFG